MNRVPRVAVIGAGISGLACGHRLLELAAQRNHPLSVEVFDAGPRPGGIICTRQEDGFLWEEGPDSFITDKPWALDLCRRLGLEADLVGTNRAFQRSYVVWNGRMHLTPEGFYLLAPARLWPFFTSSLFSWRGKLRIAGELFLPPRAPAGDESLGQFVRRRLGQEALERMAQPMAAGVYTADPETLSLRATFPKFLNMEAQDRSVIRALWKQRRRRGLDGGVSGPRYGLFMTLKPGLSKLVEALAVERPGFRLHLRTPITSVRRESGLWTLFSSDKTWPADAVCVALPAPGAARLVRPMDEALARALSAIPYASSAALHVAYARDAVRHPMDAFGFVVPTKENRSLLGCTFASVKFPGRAPEGTMLLRAFIGGDAHASLLAMDDKDLATRVQRDLAELLGISGPPIFSSLVRHEKAMPQYTLGHLDRVAHVESQAKKHPGLVLAGNGYRGLGLPDCVRSGETAAESIFRDLFRA
jgi:protoporphyrinogen/coproporphyrinogen III oxidase